MSVSTKLSHNIEIETVQQTWRWFGSADPVTLSHAKQAGATGIVSALHDQYDGRAWAVDDILLHKRKIEASGLVWKVCESIPVNDSIKLRSGPYRQYIDNWKTTLRNLAEADVRTVCYNFRPILDWSRTDLRFRLPSTGYALRFDRVDFAAYDVFILRRQDADLDYTPEILALAEQRAMSLSDSDRSALENNIIGNLPGREEAYSRNRIVARIADFQGMGADALRENLFAFLAEVLPVAQDVGVRLAIHPDDPPFPLFGSPHVVSTFEDVRNILGAFDIPEHGLTLCTGSYGAHPDNDLIAMTREFASRIHFAHLRNVKRLEHGSFFEAEHLDGDTDMIGVVQELLNEEERRRNDGEIDYEIPFRSDHGHELVGDIGRNTSPGYSCVGRLKGLAELRGVIRTLTHRNVHWSAAAYQPELALQEV